MPSDRVTEVGRAKINLALHVTGQRADGLHTLDSLVVFSDFGDRVELRRGPGLSLTIDGPFEAGLSKAHNLVLDAARMMGFEGEIRLTKNLPVAAGIGGGSADAAATIRAIARMNGVAPPDPASLAGLGADVPVCLTSSPQLMRGVGDELAKVGSLPSLHLLLVNPGIATPTAGVFAALKSKSNPPMTPLPDRVEAFVGWLQDQRNDLTEPAIAACPQIKEVLDRVCDLPGCLLARMSGSGATCFGLFKGLSRANAAEKQLSAERSDWWVQAVETVGAQESRSTT